jgi:dephospho-CoA kinase
MKVVGVTGGIGSGKSVVCNIFKHLGIPVYESDIKAHQLYEKHPETLEKIRNEISEEAIDKNGKINRKKLSEIVFNDNRKLKILNSIIHPLVKTDFNKWVNSNKGFPYVIKEAAILFESGANEYCDKIISVIAPVDLRISRVRERDHKTRAEIEQIINRQMTDEERIPKSDFVIYNDEKQMLIPQVMKIHSSLLK